MKYLIRVRIHSINPYIMLVSVVVIDLLVLLGLWIQLITGTVIVIPPLLLALIWIPPIVMILLFLLFALGGSFNVRNQRRITPAPAAHPLSNAASRRRIDSVVYAAPKARRQIEY